MGLRCGKCGHPPSDHTDGECPTPDDGSAWKDLGVICPDCGFNGEHLVADGELVYCGQCKNDMTDATDVHN